MPGHLWTTILYCMMNPQYVERHSTYKKAAGLLTCTVQMCTRDYLHWQTAKMKMLILSSSSTTPFLNEPTVFC